MSYSPVSSNTLLAYALDVLPDPLQVSPPIGNTVYAALTFSISNNSTTAVSLSKLQFQLPIGTLAQDLTASSTGVICSASPDGVWDISIDANGLCTATPSSGVPVVVTTEGIIMQLYNIAVNQQTGTISISVNETAGNSGSTPTVQSASFNVAKFPYGFYFTNFTANATQVADQGTVILTWEGSDYKTSYSITAGGSAPVDVTNVRTWTSPALTNDTTFILTASATSFGETVTTTLSTTVIVSNPELSVESLVVSGNSSLQGPLSVTGTTTINNTLSVAGATNISNSLSVSGASTLASLTVNQELTAGAGITTSQLTATDLNINGGGFFTSGYSTPPPATTYGLWINYNPEDGSGYISSSADPGLFGGQTMLVLQPNGSAVISGVWIQGTSIDGVTDENGNATPIILNSVMDQSGNYGDVWSYGYTTINNSMYVAGTLTSGSSGTMSVPADAALMEEVSAYQDGLEQVLKLNPVKFRYSETSGYDRQKEHVGLIAQDAHAIAPYLFHTSRKGKSKEEILHHDAGAMTYMLVNAVKELKAEIDALRDELKLMKEK